jgi:oligopeptide transport system ATP-binding protein
VQAEILNLLKDLQAEFGLTMIFISHDLGVIRHVSDRIGVMYLGKLVELAPADEFYDLPLHPYSDALLSAIPLPDPDAKRRTSSWKAMCRARSRRRPAAASTRVVRARSRCASDEPQLRLHETSRKVACHYPLTKAAPDLAAPADSHSTTDLYKTTI